MIKIFPMIKIFSIPFLLMIQLSTFAIAGNAPNGDNESAFTTFGNLTVDGAFVSGTCFATADASDVFGNELNRATISEDLQTIGFGTGKTINDQATMTFDQDPCNGRDEKNFQLEMEEVTFGLSSQLSNDLTLSISNTFNLDEQSLTPELTLEGNYGKLVLSESSSALSELLIGTTGSGAKTAIDVVQDGHVKNTTGLEDNYSLTYYTPSFSGVELGIGTSLTSRNIGTSDSDYSTMSLGIGYETYIGETVISLGGGVEKATNKVDDLSSCLDADLVKAEAATSADAFFDGLYGGSPCGDELLSAIGMELSIDNYTLSSAFSHLNTDNADSNVWSVGFGSSVKDVDYTVGFTQESLDYARDKTNNDKVEDISTILSLDASKPLNESLDLGLSLSSSETDNVSQEQGQGTTTAWRAGVSLSFGF